MPPATVRGIVCPRRYPTLSTALMVEAASLLSSSASSQSRVGFSLSMERNMVEAVSAAKLRGLEAQKEIISPRRDFPERFVGELITRYGKASNSSKQKVPIIQRATGRL